MINSQTDVDQVRSRAQGSKNFHENVIVNKEEDEALSQN